MSRTNYLKGIDSLINEEWEDIPNAEGYKASTMGRIASCWYKKSNGVGLGSTGVMKDKWKLLSLKPRKLDNRIKTGIKYNGKHHGFYVSRLILVTFVGMCPEGMEACHNNDITTDNRLENLRWDIHINNVKDRKINGKENMGERNGSAKLKVDNIPIIRLRYKNGESQSKIAKDYNVSQSVISHLILGKTWSQVA